MGFNSSRSANVRVVANGVPAVGLIDVEVDSNSYYAGNRFRITASRSADVTGLWMQPEISLTISADVDGMSNDLITGQVDSVVHDLGTGTVEITGRDLTSLFTQAKLEETFVNQTASQVATKLANAHNIRPVVSKTTTPIGQYYRSEHNGVMLDQFAKVTTEWDLLSALAGLEGFEIWIDGLSLYFGPRAQFQSVISIDPASTMRIRLQRHLTLATDIEVTVKSWNSQQQTAIRQVARTSGRSQSGRVQKYAYLRPNLTASAAATLAQRLLSELSAQEREVEAEIRGDVSTKAYDVLMLTGTGGDFDQSYLICEVRRRFSSRTGFTQTIVARNATISTEQPASSLS